MPVREINSPDLIQDALETKAPVVVVGLSPKPHRDSHKVALYLQDNGYDVLGVHPRGEDVGSIEVSTSLDAWKNKGVEIVDVFLSPDKLDPIVDGAIEIGAKYLWLQLGVVNEEAAEKARAAGLEVIMDRCIKIEHGRRY
jgi:predicted CoA-binding protein